MEKVNKYGFFRKSFLPVENGKIINQKTPIYLDAGQEKNKLLAPSDLSINQNNQIFPKKYVLKDNYNCFAPKCRINFRFTITNFFTSNFINSIFRT